METKKTTTVFKSKFLLTDQQIKDLGVGQNDVELYRRMRYTHSFGIDTWYSALSAHTFKTVQVPLSFEEANCLIQLNRQKSLEHYQTSNVMKEERINQKTIDETIHRMEDRIQQALTKDFPNGAFAKLNTRSPKDVPVYNETNPRYQVPVYNEINKLSPSERKDPNKLTTAFIVGTTKGCKINHGTDVTQLFTESDRIREDLLKSTSFGKSLFNSHIILREWLDEVPERPQFEFRAFVYENHLNAITQYFSFCEFEELQKRQNEIKAILLDFFETQVKGKISHESFVVDFYLKKNNEVMVIELNPFHNGAGAGLFDWAKDRELFLNGPLQMRVLEKGKSEGQDPVSFIPNRWRRWIDEQFEGQTDKKRGGIPPIYAVLFALATMIVSYFLAVYLTK